MPIPIDVQVPLSLPLQEIVRLAIRAESLGFAGIGIPEHLNSGRDVFLALDQVATNTSTVTLYPSVTNPVTRHPFVLANLINTLNESACGRVKLAIAPGDSGISGTNRLPASLGEMRSAVNMIKTLLKGQTLNISKEIRHAIPVGGDVPPIAIAASGPRMTALAAEVGDEAILMAGLNSAMLAAAQRDLETGAQRVGKNLSAFRVTHYTLVSIDENPGVALERTRNWLFFWLQGGQFNNALKSAGIVIPPFKTANEIPHSWLKTLSDLLFVAGTPEHCQQRLREVEHLGIRHLACLFPGKGDLHESTIETLAKIR